MGPRSRWECGFGATAVCKSSGGVRGLVASMRLGWCTSVSYVNQPDGCQTDHHRCNSIICDCCSLRLKHRRDHNSRRRGFQLLMETSRRVVKPRTQAEQLDKSCANSSEGAIIGLISDIAALTFAVRCPGEEPATNCLLISIFACHPCAGAVLIFLVSFQL